MDRPPYFAFYPADFANDIKVESMSTLQVGAYILLLCKAWQSDPPATLPSDDAVLARLARVELAVWTEIKPVVLDAFRIGADGRLMNKRLRAEFDKASRLIRDRRKASQLGNGARWGDPKRIANGSQTESDGTPIAIQSQSQIKSQNKDRKPLPDATASGVVKPPTTSKVRKTKEPDPIFDALVAVTGSDPKVNASHVVKVKNCLAKAEPPYTVEEILRMADPDFQSRELKWKTGEKLTLGEVEKFISRTRNPSDAKRPGTASRGRDLRGDEPAIDPRKYEGKFGAAPAPSPLKGESADPPAADPPGETEHPTF